MKHTRRHNPGQRITRLILVLGAWALTASHAAGDSITLKPIARLAGDHATLADVAELDGPYAESLAGTIVMKDVSGMGADGGLRLTERRFVGGAAVAHRRRIATHRRRSTLSGPRGGGPSAGE